MLSNQVYIIIKVSEDFGGGKEGLSRPLLTLSHLFHERGIKTRRADGSSYLPAY